MKRISLPAILGAFLAFGAPVRAQCELTHLIPSDGMNADEFGFWVAMDAGSAIVGSAEHAPGGAAYVYVHQDGGTSDPWDDSWVEIARLHGSGSTGQAEFGSAVALVGGRAVVGASGEGTGGAAYVFERDDQGTVDPLDDTWDEVARLTPPVQSQGDLFGARVTLYGETILISAHADDEAGTDAGAVHAFERDSQGNWVWTSKIFAADAAAGDEFGLTPTLWEDTFVVGARFDQDNGTKSGSGYVFERDDMGTPLDRLDDTWVQTAKLHPHDALSFDYFAQNTTLFEDTAIFSKHFDDDACDGDLFCESGAAYVFERDDMGTPEDHLDDNWIETAKLVASDGRERDYFGLVPFLEGDRALLSANGVDDSGTDSGAAYYFVRDDMGTPQDRFDDAWVEVAKLGVQDARARDEFGYGLAIDGNLGLVGARFDDGIGGVRVFDLDLVCPAGVVPRLGTGIDPYCFTTVTSPRLGEIWTAQLDTSGYSDPWFSVLYGLDAPLAMPLLLPAGELLVDAQGGHLLLQSIALSSPYGIDLFSYLIPNLPSLIGFRVYAQAAILGGTGVELCNALDVIVGI